VETSAKKQKLASSPNDKLARNTQRTAKLGREFAQMQTKNNTIVVGKIIVLDYKKLCQIAQNKTTQYKRQTQLELEDIKS